MALNPDDLDPPKPKLQQPDLTALSIGELETYIASLESEISRARLAIEKKQSHRNAIESIFKS